MNSLKLLDVVATLKPIPADRLSLVEPEYETLTQLPTGLVGTIVEIYQREENWYLVEFADLQGQAYTFATATGDELLALRYELDPLPYQKAS